MMRITEGRLGFESPGTRYPPAKNSCREDIALARVHKRSAGNTGPNDPICYESDVEIGVASRKHKQLL
ncbi:hypothetical protein GO755_27500 [Spirosoma sp. HMF4905]|uniref:Uncharacterized protein n=1 Tax=Spirosoma arboris TaxID=2682092 RepID=A0A7K1SJA1_9BACT|nr:hypothetical protein [Spirosoma arboris]MVM33814.1 hypothetical protein [Spirosoma arboris]